MLINIQNMTKIYQMGASTVPALDGISIAVNSGEFVAIVGESGSGKSTLMNMLGCLDAPTDGVYELMGESVLAMNDKKMSEIRSRTIGFIFQGFNLIPSLTAIENVELPLIYKKIPRGRRREMCRDALCRVGLADRMSHLPNQLSGGQQQRVAIARAIAAKPPIILADEPTGNLDSVSGGDVMKILEKLHREGHTVVLITHSPEIAALAGRIIHIKDGLIIKDAVNK